MKRFTPILNAGIVQMYSTAANDGAYVIYEEVYQAWRDVMKEITNVGKRLNNLPDNEHTLAIDAAIDAIIIIINKTL